MDSFTHKRKIIKPIKLSGPIKKSFNLGGTMVVDKSFDVKNYLNFIEKEENLKKKFKNLNLYSTSQFSTFNLNDKKGNFIYEAYNRTSFNHSPAPIKRVKKAGTFFSPEINKKKYLYTATTGYQDYNSTYKSNDSYYNSPHSKNSTNFVYNMKSNSKYSGTQTDENFNINKIIKEIKKSYKIPKLVIKKKSYNNKANFKANRSNNNDRNINNYNFERAPLAYKKEYFDTVYDSRKIINTYNMRKGLILDPPENLLTFNKNKNNISVKNIIIDLLNKESERLNSKERSLRSKLEKNKNILNNNMKEFEGFMEEQRKICKNIEHAYDNLQNGGSLLLDEFLKFKAINKNYVDEIQKHLEQIERLRVYALFVHQALGKDISKFSKTIFPNFRPGKIIDDYDNKIEKIRNNVIQIFTMLWEPKHKEKLKEEIKFLEEPDLLTNKLNEIEKNIRRLMLLKDDILKDILSDEKEHNAILDDLRCKYEKEEKEYLKIKEEIDIEMNSINKYIKRENEQNIDIVKLIGSLFLEIVNEFGKNDKNKFIYNYILNSKIDKGNVDICIKEGERILKEQEGILNNALLSIKLYQEKDERFLSQVMDEAKKKSKLKKQLLFKKNKISKQLEEEVEANNKAKKLTLISKKIAIPYHHMPKKKEKKVLDLDLIRRLEDEELIKYQ
jgi:hypothetical protein